MIKSALIIATVSGLTALPAVLIVRPNAEQFHARAIDLPAIGHRIEAHRALHGDLPPDAIMIAWASAFDDPWGRPYRFERHDGGMKIFTLGADGALGGDDSEFWIITCASASAPDTCATAEPRRPSLPPRESRCTAPTSASPGSR